MTGLDGALEASRMSSIGAMLEEEALRVCALGDEHAGAAPLSEEWIAHLGHLY